MTGSSGFIGRAVCEALMKDGHAVIALDRPGADEPPAGAVNVPCDITSEQSVSEAVDRIRREAGASLACLIHLTKDESVRDALSTLRGRHGDQVASCVHLAAHYDFSGEPSPLYQTLTIEGTRRLLRGLQDLAVEQFVFSSTHIVMKPAGEGDVITESSPVEPAWDYPKSKLEAEQVIRNERGRIPAVILRLAGVYDADTHVVPIAQQMRRIYEKQFESYFFPGDATHGQAFVHLDDTVACIRKAVERRDQLEPYEVFLVAEPDVMSYADLQEQLGELIHGEEWPTIRIPKTVAKVGAWVQEKLAGEQGETFIKPWMIDLADDHYPIAIDHARRKLGWEAVRRLRTTLPEMASRLKRDPETWYRTNKLEAPESLPKSPSR